MVNDTAPIGVVLYDGPSLLDKTQHIVAIATLESRNRKTGDMVQVWILHRDLHPVDELALDVSPICGDCPLRNSVCYVVVGQAPSAVWRTYWNDGYPEFDADRWGWIFEGRQVRWGAYGDPAALPLTLVHRINRLADGHTGYTHQWKSNMRRAARLARVFMLSADTDCDRELCNEYGWRCFQVTDEGAEDSVECPAYTHGVQCKDCLLCCGTQLAAKHVWARPHGIRAGNFKEVASA